MYRYRGFKKARKPRKNRAGATFTAQMSREPSIAENGSKRRYSVASVQPAYTQQDILPSGNNGRQTPGALTDKSAVSIQRTDDLSGTLETLND
jgi:hypothetical protein